MPRLAKFHLGGGVHYLTFSLEEGLLLNANELIEVLVYSALARALHLHPVTICHFLIEANHVHMIIVVQDPQDVSGFMKCFKTETSHYMNRLLGRDKRTVWCEGYDSPLIPDESTIMDKIEYIYTNPAKDNLEDSIDKYPGISSWHMWKNGNYKKDCAWIHRPMVEEIPKDKYLPSSKYSFYAGRCLKYAKESHIFELKPDEWIKACGIDNKERIKQINKELRENIAKKELYYREEREAKGISVMGAAKLRARNMDLSYRSKRSGRRTWCVSSDLKLRKIIIAFIKRLVAVAREVYERWKIGDFSVAYPIGLYPPSMPRQAELMPNAIFGC